MAQEPYLAGGMDIPSPVYVDAAHGWNYSDYSHGSGFSVLATSGDNSFMFSLNATDARIGDRVHLEIDRGGTTCGDNDLDAIVRDLAASPSGAVTRLDVVYAEPCFYSLTSGFLSGELTFNETPRTAVQSVPAELFLPPTDADSATATYPVRLQAGTMASQAISSLQVHGLDADYFSLSHDECSGHTVTSTTGCSVEVTYRPHAGEDTATLVASDAAGRVVSTTPLDAALLPGASYWAVTVPQADNRVTTYTGAANTITASISPNAPNAGGPRIYDDQVWLYGRNGGASEIEIGSAHPIVPGVYSINDPSKFSFRYSFDGLYYGRLTGFVRITSVSASVPDRGLKPSPELAFTFAFRTAGATTPIYGAVGYDTTTPIRVPGDTALDRLGDYDGNGTTDIAVFRPTTGAWYVRGHNKILYGAPGDAPVPGDYDGNGTTDVAVFRPTTSTWHVRGGFPLGLGATGDLPVPGPYSSDYRSDAAVFAPGSGTWTLDTTYGRSTVRWGARGDIPV